MGKRSSIVLVGCTVAACSSSRELTPDGGRCVGELATVGAACARTFDGTEANLAACPGVSQRQTVWRCQDLFVVQFDFGLGGGVCYYDTTSHALVGAEEVSDIGAYCNQTSLGIEAGRTNSMCRENAPLFTHACSPPDGGQPPDADNCEGDLATIGAACPGTFDGSDANLPACSGGVFEFRSAWQCQDLLLLVLSFGFGGSACYYDAGSHALVGAEWISDTGICEPGIDKRAGRTNNMCRENAPLFSHQCLPDAGS